MMNLSKQRWPGQTASQKHLPHRYCIANGYIDLDERDERDERAERNERNERTEHAVVAELAELAEFHRNPSTAARISIARRQTAIESPATAWNSAEPCAVTKYTEGKVIETHGCRWHPALKCLLVPLRTVDGEIKSLQLIYNDGMKLFWPGTPTKSAFFLIGTILSEILICKGMATGSSRHKRTGKAVACVMYHGNLLAVAEAIRNRFPNLAITICGDDERQIDGNPGRTKATEAANAVSAKLDMPKLCHGCNCTDFNDQANCSHGVEL